MHAKAPNYVTRQLGHCLLSVVICTKGVANIFIGRTLRTCSVRFSMCAMFLRSKGFVYSDGMRYLASCEFHHADDRLAVEAPNCVTSSRVKTIRSLENVMYANRCVQDFCGLVTHERCTQFNLR